MTLHLLNRTSSMTEEQKALMSEVMRVLLDSEMEHMLAGGRSRFFSDHQDTALHAAIEMAEIVHTALKAAEINDKVLTAVIIGEMVVRGISDPLSDPHDQEHNDLPVLL